MARLHPGDPPIQGPTPGLPGIGETLHTIGPWRPEVATGAAKPVRPGTPLRPIVREQRLVAACSLVAGVCFALAAVISGTGPTFTTVLPVLVGAPIGVAVAMSIDPVTTRYGRPHVWPPGCEPEPSRRLTTRVVALTLVLFGGMGIAFVATGDARALAPLAVYDVVFAAGSAFSARRLKRLEQSLAVTLHRDLANPLRGRFRPQYFALVDNHAQAGH